MSSEGSPSKEVLRKALWSHLRALFILVAVLTAGGYWIARHSGGSSDVDIAREIVGKVVATPSSLEFFGGELALTEAEWRLVTLEYDLQNEFGATVRHHDCVVFKRLDGKYEWSPQLAVQPCDVARWGQVLISMNRSALSAQR
jgi:hypothetical protein